MAWKTDLSILALAFLAARFLFLAPVSEAQSSYELIARVKNPRVDPGGRLAVEFYLTGFGDVTSSKLTIYFPVDLLNSQDAGVIEANFGDMENETGIYPVVWVGDLSGHRKNNTWKLDPRIVLIGLSVGYFLPDPTDPDLVWGERMHGDESVILPPIAMRCNVSNDFFLGGDYRIEAVLTYESRGVWYTSTYPIVVHVNTIPERLWWFGALGIFVTVAGLLWRIRSRLKRGAKGLWMHARDISL